MNDDRPHVQLRVTDAEFTALVRTTAEMRFRSPWGGVLPKGWSAEDQRVFDAVSVLAPDLAKEVGRSPTMFDIVVVRPDWLLTTGEVKRWTKDPIPKETK